jgi:vacuolar-type H+-ATPase subunit I/STV1
MPKLQYSNTVIYQLVCATYNDIYVNYTTNLYVRKYTYTHPEKVRKPLEFQDTIDLHGGFDNWKMIVLEKYPDCKCTDDAMKKVNEWTKKLKEQPETIVLDTPDITHLREEISILREQLAKRDEQIVKMGEELKTMTDKFNQLTKPVNEISTSQKQTQNQNTIKLVQLGNENICDIMPISQQNYILSKKHKSIDHLVEITHFNPKYKQFQNVCITNIHDSIAYKYIEKHKCFMAVSKDDILHEILDIHLGYLDIFYENCSEIMDEKTRTIIPEVIKKFENKDEDIAKKCKDIKSIIYNNSKKVDMKNVMKNIMKTNKNNTNPSEFIQNNEGI